MESDESALQGVESVCVRMSRRWVVGGVERVLGDVGRQRALRVRESVGSMVRADGIEARVKARIKWSESALGLGCHRCCRAISASS